MKKMFSVFICVLVVSFLGKNLYGVLLVNNTNVDIRVCCNERGLFLDEIIKSNDRFFLPESFEDERKNIENSYNGQEVIPVPDGFDLNLFVRFGGVDYCFYFDYINTCWPLFINRIDLLAPQDSETKILSVYFVEGVGRRYFRESVRVFWV